MIPIINLQVIDAKDGLAQLENNSIDLIFTDPPYLKKDVHLYELLAKEAKRILKPHAHLITYVGNVWTPKVFSILEKHLTYRLQITLVHKEGGLIVWSTRVLSMSKAILVYTKGPIDRHAPIMATIFSDKGYSKAHHIWEQNIAFPLYAIPLTTNPRDTVLDPFCGGGTTAQACKILNRNCITFDNNPKCIEITNKRLSNPFLTEWVSPV